MNPTMRAPLGAALAVLVALSVLAASPLLVAVVTCGIVVMVAMGWPELLELPSRRGTRAVMVLTGIAGVAMALWSPGSFSPVEGIATVAALGVFASFVHQMLRPDRSDLTASLTGTASGALLTGLSACWVQASALIATDAAQRSELAACAVILAVVLALLAPPLHPVVTSSVAVLAAIGTAAVLLPAAGTALLPSLVAGAVIGAGTAATHRLLSSLLLAREPVPSLTVAAAPVATAGVVVLLVARLVA
ncbi:hypothetical protein [Brachybacterium huguangmaarense]